MYGAGELDQYVTFQSRAAGQDTRGQADGEWATAFDTWAKVEPLGTRDRFAAAQAQSEVTVRFVIRHRAGVLPTMRVLWKGRPYYIEGEPTDIRARGEYLQVLCYAGGNDGR